MKEPGMVKAKDYPKTHSLRERLRRMLQPSGGWGYHRKHLLHSKRWQGFKSELNNWLESRLAPQEHLVLVGSSAGYNISDGFLFEFEKLTAIEIDPLAPWFWSKTHKLKINEWSDHNHFGGGQRISPQGFSEIREKYPHSQLLFSNLLGQLGLLYDIDHLTAAQLKEELRRLKGPWASFHDVFSLHGSARELKRFQDNFTQPSNRAELVHNLVNWQVKLDVRDHWTMDIIPETDSAAYFLWPLTRNSLHIVEAVSYR